ncbi:MAG: envelope stress response membrane protein PspB [Oceanococcaceae bacterium]
MDPLELIFVPLVVFVALVLPVWIVAHYVTIWRREKRDRSQITGAQNELETLADRLERRLDVIEQLLDADEPDWRTHR